MGSVLLLLVLLAGPGPLAAQSVLSTAEEPPAAAGPAEEGPPVAAIEIRSEAPLDDERHLDLEGLLDVAVGAPLSDRRIRRTLRNFEASGVSAQVELYSRPAVPPEGDAPEVIAIVVLRPPVRVLKVDVEGELGLSRSDLLAAVQQRLGEPLNEDRVVRSVYALQDLYEANGYFHARARPRVSTDPVKRTAEVIFEVAAGPRAKLAAISFEGPIAPFTPEALIKQLKASPGDSYRKAALKDAAERLQTWLVRQQHNLARVEDPKEERDEATDAVRVTYPIDVGPRLEVAIVGAEMKKLRRHGLLPFLDDEGYDEALVLQALAKIKDSYQQQGYYHVKVDSAEQREESPQGSVLRLTITIEPGREYRLTEVDFQGNEGVSDEQLAELMTVSPRRLLALGSGRLVESELKKDLDNIRSYYALQGYAEAEAGPPEVLESGDTLRLVVPIREGPRRTVGTLAFEGFENIDLAEVRQRMSLQDGGPFHPALLESSLDAVRAVLAEKGYDEAQVSAEQRGSADGSTVDLVVRAIPGPQAVVDRVIVRGNLRTTPEVIRRTAGLKRGEPVSDTRLLETERGLYRLGIFSRVDVDLTRPGLGAANRDVVIRVEEGKPRTLTYGVGYDSESGARGLLGFTHNNVAGRAYSLVTDLRVAQRDQRARVIFDQPFLGSLPIPLTSTLFYLHDDEVEQKGVNSRKWGVRTEASKILGQTRYGLAFDYRVVESDLSEGVALNDLERQNSPLHIASVVPSVLLDHRDDPVLPSRGWSSLAQTQYSFPALGSEAEFLKIFLQQTQYVRLGRAGVLALSGRVGGIQPFQMLAMEDPTLPPELPNSNVFISERFFLGGSTTHRAYGRDLLGIPFQTLFPRDPEKPTEDFIAVGGNGTLLFNFDFRFPIAGPVGGTVFYDLGNVWADWRGIDPGELKGGVGLGLRYISPIGPLRVEAGWKLDREKFEKATPVYFLSFGNPF